jgi:PKD repeat protein
VDKSPAKNQRMKFLFPRARTRRLFLTLLMGLFIFSTTVFAADTAKDLLQGLVTTDDTDLEQECAGLSETFAGALGCSQTSQVIDFTEYEGSFEAPSSEGYDEALTQNTSARGFIQTIVNFALSFLALISVVVVIYGGLMYALSRGDEEMTSKGKKSITYASVGIIIIMGSFAFVNTLFQAGGGSTDSGLASGNNGETITDAGADFNVDAVLGNIEDITQEYIAIYQRFIAVQADVEYMRSLDLPFAVSTSTDTTGFENIFQGIAWTQTDEDLFIDQSWINDFVNEYRSESQDIQNRVETLSVTYEQAQELYNYLRSGLGNGDIEADTEPSTSQTLSSKESFLNQIIPSAQADFTDDLLDLFIQQYTAGSCATRIDGDSSSYSIEYVDEEGLFQGTRFNTSGNDDTYTFTLNIIDETVCDHLDDIEEANALDYKKDVEALIVQFSELEELFDTDEINSAGSQLGDVQGLIKAVVDPNPERVTCQDQEYGGTLGLAQCRIGANTVNDVITSMSNLYASVENIDFVAVRLSASETRGNAPFIINVDVLGSTDPAGETIQDDQIEWDPFGNGVFLSFYSENAYGNAGDLIGEANLLNIGDTTTIRFDEEGTYKVRVRISSQDDDIAAGVATLTIIVEAPKSKMVLTAESDNDAQPTVLADYSLSTVPFRIDRDNFKVTESEAEDGIFFDASDTTDGEGNPDGIVFFEWDFGDGEALSGTRSEAENADHPYGASGTYNASLTITDATGVEDRKYFNVIVGSPAARIVQTPYIGEVGTEFYFDGSLSSADVGTIVDYSWSADSEVDLSSNDDPDTTGIADEPGIFDIRLTVTDSNGDSDSISATIVVESQTPVPYFEWEIPSSYQPATVNFDASDSYDPDEEDDLEFTWDFDGEEDEDYIILAGDDDEELVTVQYLRVNTYKVELTVCDDHNSDLQKCATIIKNVEIDSILDVNMEVEGENARHLDENSEAEVEFIGYTEVGNSFRFDFGDGETAFTDTITSGQTVVSHIYKEAGVYYVTGTALDIEGDENSITRRVYIGTGDEPIPVLDLSISGVDIGSAEPFIGDITKTWNFDATESLNLDGNPDNLRYSWNFGDGTVSSLKSVTHRFDENTTYTVTLTVSDSDNPSITSSTSVQILIRGLDPEIRGMTATPVDSTLITPTKVNLSVDAVDEDGSINYVKFWYVDADNSAQEQSVIISQTTSATLTINTSGEEGEERDVIFYSEVVDDDGNSVFSFDELSSNPTLTVTNGENDNPIASFTVDRTSVFVGEDIVFSSQSYDPDGEIISYEWDIEGNGYFDNDAIETGSYEYAYTQVHSTGIDVGLRVTDSAGATATSTLTIYVDALSSAPIAKFLTDIEGTSVTIRENSDIDTENSAAFQGFYCDANLGSDSDGDGSGDNDIDYVLTEQGGSFTHEYGDLGTYSVTCTVTDNTGQTDTVTQTLSVIETNPPVASFNYFVDDKTVKFENLTSFDADSGVLVRSYTWDFDVDSLSDESSSRENPDFIYDDYGNYEVLLYVEDSFGKTDSFTSIIEVPSPIEPLTANISSVPTANNISQILLSGTQADITFFYSADGGSENFTYEFDKNIFFDTEGDGIRENDVDYSDSNQGSWKTTFYESYGDIVVKLTVTDDETGEKDVATIQVIFQGNLGGANLFSASPSEMALLTLSAILIAVLGASLFFRLNFVPIKNKNKVRKSRT